MGNELSLFRQYVRVRLIQARTRFVRVARPDSGHLDTFETATAYSQSAFNTKKRKIDATELMPLSYANLTEEEFEGDYNADGLRHRNVHQ